MTRKEKIEAKIKTLKAQLEYWQAEHERATVSEQQDALIFQEVPARVRNMFSNMQELRRFVYGQHDGKGIASVSLREYSEANNMTPYERLSTIRGIGDNIIRETIKALDIEEDVK